MNRLNRVTAILLTVAMLCMCIPAMAEAQKTVLHETLPVYCFNSQNVESVDAVFFTEEKDIPYISLSSVAEFKRNIAKMVGDSNYSVTDGFYTYGELEESRKVLLSDDVDRGTTVYMMERENGSFVLFDAADNTIWMSDRDKFFVSSYAVSGGDLVSIDGVYHTGDEGEEPAVNLYKRANGSKFVREGDVTNIGLGDYDINIEVLDGQYYLPVATVSDLLLGFIMAYNGEALFVTYSVLDNTTVNDDGKTQQDLYYAPAERQRSADLISFNYNELCLLLDQVYGLTSEHRINNGFNDYFVSTGLINGLYSTDLTDYTEALNQLVDGYFGDMHSSLRLASPYSGGKVNIEGLNKSISLQEDEARTNRFTQAREAAGITVDGQIVNGYTEIGDTAFITFDSFNGASMDYYDKSLWENFGDIYMSDTISLVIWAQNRIHRENSPIKKVVIDLSCNGGGSVDACIYIAAWVLGTASLNLENVQTGAQYTTNYWVDTNLDGKCTNDDDLGVDDLDVYCLISGCSFSCGNLLPAMFKEDGRVTLVGQASGGGSCAVHSAVTADGTFIAISDYRKLCLVKNGSFYGIDEGVEPDIPLRKCASYYDRESLMEYLSAFK